MLNLVTTSRHSNINCNLYGLGLRGLLEAFRELESGAMSCGMSSILGDVPTPFACMSRRLCVHILSLTGFLWQKEKSEMRDEMSDGTIVNADLCDLVVIIVSNVTSILQLMCVFFLYSRGCMAKGLSEATL